MGVVGGSREYDGPGLGWAPWKCPACGVDQQGPLDEGCTSCGAGSARPQHVGIATPADLHLPTADEPPVFKAVERPIPQSDSAAPAAQQWADAHPDATLAEAFVAGYQLATSLALTKLLAAAPPVTADIESLAPAGKLRRTIIAALELFKDQVLREASDEIASGEWCSVDEVDAAIAQMKETADHD